VKTEKLVPYYKAEVTFTREDVDALMQNSARHYDGECRNAGKLGGFLYGISNRFVAVPTDQTVTVELWAIQLDLLAKICERDGPGRLFCSLVDAFQEIQRKQNSH
jgi:hypothetical protein